MQHGATRHTDRTVSTTRDVSFRKRGATFDQPVDIRRVNSFVAQASNRVKTLVVREDHENVWLTHALVPARRCCLDFFGQLSIRRDGVFAARTYELMHH